ncbi:MAG: 50S ribosomal protein L10 [Candidatus Pacebacteria bacterium]|nr:50S ribosomal protein L10 [Candidatus Paceibacterota bacterium]
MLNKDQKKEIVKNLRKKFKENKLAVFCNFEGITVIKQRDLKKQFKESDGEVFVIKKNLLKKALLEENLKFPEINGSIIIGIGKDETLPAKIIDKLPLEKKERIDFIGGILNDEGKIIFLEKDEIESIAKLPSREEILAKLVSVIRAPISNLNFVLKANIQKLTYILANIKSE